MSVSADSHASVSLEAARRRTFAIISHPDAGKTTLTEKFLLYGGAVVEAGAVKARAGRRSARSDWMEMEQERGISITSTVLQFAYRDHVVNLLDTPGHRDSLHCHLVGFSLFDGSTLRIHHILGRRTGSSGCPGELYE